MFDDQMDPMKASVFNSYQVWFTENEAILLKVGYNTSGIASIKTIFKASIPMSYNGMIFEIQKISVSFGLTEVELIGANSTSVLHISCSQVTLSCFDLSRPLLLPMDFEKNPIQRIIPYKGSTGNQHLVFLCSNSTAAVFNLTSSSIISKYSWSNLPFMVKLRKSTSSNDYLYISGSSFGTGGPWLILSLASKDQTKPGFFITLNIDSNEIISLRTIVNVDHSPTNYQITEMEGFVSYYWTQLSDVLADLSINNNGQVSSSSNSHHDSMNSNDGNSNDGEKRRSGLIRRFKPGDSSIQSSSAVFQSSERWSTDCFVVSFNGISRTLGLLASGAQGISGFNFWTPLLDPPLIRTPTNVPSITLWEMPTMAIAGSVFGDAVVAIHTTNDQSLFVYLQWSSPPSSMAALSESQDAKLSKLKEKVVSGSDEDYHIMKSLDQNFGGSEIKASQDYDLTNIQQEDLFISNGKLPRDTDSEIVLPKTLQQKCVPSDCSLDHPGICQIGNCWTHSSAPTFLCCTSSPLES